MARDGSDWWIAVGSPGSRRASLLNDNHRIEENGAFGLQDVGLALAGLTRLPSRKLIVVQFESLAARVARKYGISDVALSNVCRQLQIPKAGPLPRRIIEHRPS